jgi:hypothetical protein
MARYKCIKCGSGYSGSLRPLRGNCSKALFLKKSKTNKTMEALTGVSDDEIDGVWLVDGAIRYPGMETVDDAIYPYLLYKKYEQNPTEAANHIIAMANELEKI